jgi:nucleotide-binding universal stress UspA family protein
MFTKLLVAVDLSLRNEDVFEAGLDLAKNTGASLMLLHVPSSDAPECPSLPTMIGPDYYPLSGTASTIEIYENSGGPMRKKGWRY